MDNKVLVTVSNGKEDKQFWTCNDPDDSDWDGAKRSIKERISDLEHDLEHISKGILEPHIEFKIDPGYSIKSIKRIKEVPEGVPEYPMY